MYVGFNLKIEDASKFENDGNYTNLLEIRKHEIELKIKDIMLDNECIDAEKIVKEWFPIDNYHVFISHSHKDIKMAEELANWLYEKFKITSFIDSHVWGYADKLLYNINDLYARNYNNTFKYVPVISYAANVNLMLSTALNEVMDKSECLFFINSSNSINSIKLNDGDHDLRTSSAWIMHELKSSAIMRRQLSVNRPKVTTESMGIEAHAENMLFYHQAPTQHLIEINERHLTKWHETCFPSYSRHISSMQIAKKYKQEFDALDLLYQLTN